MSDIQPPHSQFPLVNQAGDGEDRFFGWIRALTERVNFLTPLEGSGDPNGTVEAALHRQYIDTDYPVGATLYLNIDGGTTWQVIG